MYKTPRKAKAPAVKNRTPVWLTTLIFVIITLAIIYALPILFGESPSIQVSKRNGEPVSAALQQKISGVLKSQKIDYSDITKTPNILTVKFSSVDSQLAAQTALEATLAAKNPDEPSPYVIALNLLPNTPKWLLALGASPMKLGLDLRGGMYFLLNIDLQEMVNNNLQNNSTNIMNDFRKADIRYSGVNFVPNKGIVIRLRDATTLTRAQDFLEKNYPSLQFIKSASLTLTGHLMPNAKKTLEDEAANATLQVMRNRINELGVAEATVAKEGDNRIVIELPGVQDATRAKAVIGGTATLKVMLVNENANAAQATQTGKVPVGSSLYYDTRGIPYVLYNNVIITGNTISGAKVGYSQQTNAPVVNVTLTGPDVSYFSKVTGENVGHLMAIVLVQSMFDQKKVGDKVENVTHTTQTIISAANIESQLGNRFQITGIGNATAAKNLALSIRAGALPAPIQIAEEKQIGPSLGAQNIKMGGLSILVAFLVVVAFIAFYYSVFGLIADACLFLNLIFIVAVMALLPGATLTLPGIAGIVLNVGMAIDANVLIFERIREEIRKGTSNMLAIATGYDRAFATILDANVTTFMVALILFAIGTGMVKGFATTLMIGIVTSFFSATVVGRAMVNFVYGRHPNRKLKIGI